MKTCYPTRRNLLIAMGATGAELVACGSDGTTSNGASGGSSAGGDGPTGGRGPAAGSAGRNTSTPTGMAGGNEGGEAGALGSGGAAEGGGGPDANGGASGGESNPAGGPSVGGEGGSPAVQCETKPEQILGPFPNKSNLDRSDVRAGQPGRTLRIKFRVRTSILCMPIAGATVEIWQCNALGDYSEYSEFGTADQNWLRGFQVTNAAGIVDFITIYPGWYPGRAVHVHFRIKRQGKPDFTSQLYFDDALSDQVLAQAPYTEHAGVRPRNQDDSFFTGDGGSDLILAVQMAGGELSATFDLAV